MKREIMSVFLMAVLLSGCGNKVQSKKIPVPETSASAITETAAPETVVYEIVPLDHSLRNENGDVLVESIYERIVLQGTAPGIDAINEAIGADSDEFFAYSGIHMYAENAEQMLRDFGMAYGDLFHNAVVEVTHNDEYIVSIRMTTDWFMGGVFNRDYYGMTFNLQTGERVELKQLSDLSAEQFEQQLKDIVVHWLWDTYGEGMFAEPETVLAAYTLKDMLFYVEAGELILTFPTYTFTAGASGAAVIPTGIHIADITK